jgi:hypothetical protein
MEEFWGSSTKEDAGAIRAWRGCWSERELLRVQSYRGSCPLTLRHSMMGRLSGPNHRKALGMPTKMERKVMSTEVHEECHGIVAFTVAMGLLLPHGDDATVAQGIYFSSSRAGS